jgi:hypothetical protein
MLEQYFTMALAYSNFSISWEIMLCSCLLVFLLVATASSHYFWLMDFIQMAITVILCEMQAELGANTMLAVSIAACKAGAAEKEVLVYAKIIGV